MTETHVISTSDLSRRYGTLCVLEGVSLSIAAGECVALVGPNGAGKSTLLKICLGLIVPSGGKVSVLGSRPDTGAFNAVKRQIGFLPEQVIFQGSMTGRETLRFYSRLKQADAALNDGLLARVQLSDAADRRVTTYSKGMRQRLGLAQALVGSPKLLLLDEPMSGLDPQARLNFFRILEEEKARGTGIVLSSHILTELEARTDRVAILHKGTLRTIGPVDALCSELGLNARIRIRAGKQQMSRLAEAFSGRFKPTCFMNGAAVLEYPAQDELKLLKELMASDVSLDDLDILEPSLEQIFSAHTAGDWAE